VLREIGIWWRKKRKIREFQECDFCEKTNPDKNIGWATYGGHIRYFYHQKCLEGVCKNPEAHHHRKVDFALRILEELDYQANCEKKRKERFEELCKNLKERCNE